MSDGSKDQRRYEVAKRRAQALELRISGMSYRAIADAMQCADSTAYELVQSALREIPAQNVEILRTEHDAMIRMLFSKLMPRIDKGEPRAIEVGVKLLERLAKLWGLDAPTRKVLEVITESVIDEAIAALEAELRADDQD
ncbi:helix-turn-helix domain-containing protein [Ferrimicrobium sp.]|uniref:helix-turn-helix domain-containing protein n=1 Tax=Ferrimicrobium sp. TaxID=2926050 RepID=UPI0026095E7C|nr:helix-turn-helix domain-containing protein [Ferrimicrobium sp.]